MLRPIARWIRLRPYISTTLFILLLTLVLLPFARGLDLVNMALVYLLPVLLNAVYLGKRPAFFAALLGVLAFDFFFVPPVLSFTVDDLRYLGTFAFFLAVASLTAGLASRLKQQVHYAKTKEAQTAALYAISKEMSSVASLKTMLERFLEQVPGTFRLEIAIYLKADESPQLLFAGRSAMLNSEAMAFESDMAKQIYEQENAIAQENGTVDESAPYFAPLQVDNRLYGVMVYYLADSKAAAFTEEQKQIFETLTGIAASTIARLKLAEEAKIAHLSAESERMRTAILDSVSHELRTPLAAVIGSATSLMENDHLFSASDRMELLITVRDGALRMNRLVKNLLNMVQLESGMLYFKQNWCDLEDIIEATLGQMKDFKQHRSLRVVMPQDEPVIVPGDEVLLEQVLMNMVSNAIKYSPDYSEIVITVSTNTGHAVLSISDQGAGIKPSDYDRIFEKFYRAEGTKHISGTGLGLAICKGIVELHGGTIAVHANHPHGAVLTVTLPLIRIEHDKGGNAHVSE